MMERLLMYALIDEVRMNPAIFNSSTVDQSTWHSIQIGNVKHFDSVYLMYASAYLDVYLWMCVCVRKYA